MWLALSEGFLSIVGHRDKPEHLLVRARNRKHLRRAFPNAEIYFNPLADYPFRADILREDVISFISKRMSMMTYENFKNTIGEERYHDAAIRIWETMNDYGRPHRSDEE